MSASVTPWTPQSMGLSRREYWSGQPCPSPGVLLDPGTESGSPALQADSLPSELPGPLRVSLKSMVPAPYPANMVPWKENWSEEGVRGTRVRSCLSLVSVSCLCSDEFGADGHQGAFHILRGLPSSQRPLEDG